MWKKSEILRACVSFKFHFVRLLLFQSNTQTIGVGFACSEADDNTYTHISHCLETFRFFLYDLSVEGNDNVDRKLQRKTARQTGTVEHLCTDSRPVR